MLHSDDFNVLIDVYAVIETHRRWLDSQGGLPRALMHDFEPLVCWDLSVPHHSSHHLLKVLIKLLAQHLVYLLCL